MVKKANELLVSHTLHSETQNQSGLVEDLPCYVNTCTPLPWSLLCHYTCTPLPCYVIIRVHLYLAMSIRVHLYLAMSLYVYTSTLLCHYTCTPLPCYVIIRVHLYLAMSIRVVLLYLAMSIRVHCRASVVAKEIRPTIVVKSSAAFPFQLNTGTIMYIMHALRAAWALALLSARESDFFGRDCRLALGGCSTNWQILLEKQWNWQNHMIQSYKPYTSIKHFLEFCSISLPRATHIPNMHETYISLPGNSHTKQTCMKHPFLYRG